MKDDLFTPVTGPRRVHGVLSQITTAIEQGEIEPDQRLPPEKELVRRLGVSRATVREALRWLRAREYVEPRTGSGWYVVAPPRRPAVDLDRWLDRHGDETRELFWVRGRLDELAAEDAARGGGSGLAAVRDAHDAFVLAAEAGARGERLEELDARFSAAIARASGNHVLAQLLEGLHEHLADARPITLARRSRRVDDTIREHAAIVAAIEAADPAAARAAMARHVRALGTILDAVLVGRGGAPVGALGAHGER